MLTKETLMDNPANEYYSAGMYIQRQINQHQTEIDYLVILHGLLVDEKELYDRRYFQKERRRIIKAMRQHAVKSRRLQRRHNKYMRIYHKLNRKEGWE